jgi:hypothetical protein
MATLSPTVSGRHTLRFTLAFFAWHTAMENTSAMKNGQRPVPLNYSTPHIFPKTQSALSRAYIEKQIVDNISYWQGTSLAPAEQVDKPSKL